MTKHSLFLSAALVSVSISVFGCASDPNKQADDAHNAELKSERKQLQNDADNRSDSRVTAAEIQRGNTQASATGTPAAKDTVAADAKLTEARAVFRAKSTERLEKANARTAELKAIVDKAGAKASTASRDSLKTVDTHYTMVARQIEQLPSVSNDDWRQAKTDVDSKLDELDGLVNKAGNEVDKFKK